MAILVFWSSARTTGPNRITELPSNTRWRNYPANTSGQTLLLELLLCWNWKLGCCCFLCHWHKKKKKKKELCDENTTLVRWSRLTSTVISHVDSMSPSADMMEIALSLWSAFPKLITWTYSREEHQGISNRWASHKLYDQYSSKL